MMNANRSIAAPWNIYGDQRDSLAELESGWIQLYAENAQEAYDTILEAYKVAEDPDVMLPVMVNLDGFVLTHTYELLHTVDQDKVDAYIPLSAVCQPHGSRQPQGHLHHRLSSVQHGVPLSAASGDAERREKIKAADKAFGETFGRSYGGVVEAYKCDDAEAILIPRQRGRYDPLRGRRDARAGQEGRPAEDPLHASVPPRRRSWRIVKNAKFVGVLEKDVSFGFEGVVYTDVSSALKSAGWRFRGELRRRSGRPQHLQDRH